MKDLAIVTDKIQYSNNTDSLLFSHADHPLVSPSGLLHVTVSSVYLPP